jgi:SAM-dependent methyltransferase
MPDAPFKPDPQGFNEWHGDVAGSPACDLIFRRALALPDHVVSNSLLPWSAIPQIAAALRLAPGGVLVDLACGRGSYGRELARLTGAHLVGVDFSEVALAIAASSAFDSQAGHVASDFTAIGLRDGSASGVVCVDSLQFSDPPLAALRECRRILVPGGRLAVTAWEATDPSDERLPRRTRRMNMARDVAEAGFTEVEVMSKPDWHDTEHALWEAAARTDPDGDPGLVALRQEAVKCLATHGSKRRVLATATSTPKSLYGTDRRASRVSRRRLIRCRPGRRVDLLASC